jgi:hypothetical protein
MPTEGNGLKQQEMLIDFILKREAKAIELSSTSLGFHVMIWIIQHLYRDPTTGIITHKADDKAPIAAAVVVSVDRRGDGFHPHGRTVANPGSLTDTALKSALTWIGSTFSGTTHAMSHSSSLDSFLARAEHHHAMPLQVSACGRP